MGALIEDGALCAYWRQESAEETGKIYKGRVERVLPGMKAVFVSIGLERNGFLPQNERLTERPLQVGQEILVQVKKAPQGEKGAYLSQLYSLPGEYVLLLPGQERVGVSNRIQEAETREWLMALGREIKLPEAGLVMRANSVGTARETVAAELKSLWETWQGILHQAGQRTAPCLLSRESTYAHRLIRDYGGEIQRLITDDPQSAQCFAPLLPCESYAGETDLFELNSIPKQVDRALRPKVWLKSGGYLVINICEAMTVIDVNTGKFTGKRLLEETLLTLNLEACETIAQQVRLRCLSGIILIDFIDMAEEAHREAVAQALAREFRKDHQKTVLHGFTSLGLMEMTRKKDVPPLHQWLAAPCPHCQGTGFVKGEETIHA